MPQQLQPYNQGPALAEARVWVARLREAHWSDAGGLSPLHPQAGHRVLRGMLKSFALSHPLNMTHVCALARAGAGDAELALIELIAEFNDRGELPPTVLRAYTLELIHPRLVHRPKGQKKTAHFLQDIGIAVLVTMVVEQFGLKPTRRQPPQSSQPSGCSIVAQALKEAGVGRGDERAVEKIWQRVSPRI